MEKRREIGSRCRKLLILFMYTGKVRVDVRDV